MELGLSGKVVLVTGGSKGIGMASSGRRAGPGARARSVRGTGILNNELYLGRLVWNRLRYVKDPSTGKRVWRLTNTDHRIVVGLPELRIVTGRRSSQDKRN